MYWVYPNDYDLSNWKQKGVDSLFLKSGLNAKMEYDFSYKYRIIGDTIMTWEESKDIGLEGIRRTIYRVRKL